MQPISAQPVPAANPQKGQAIAGIVLGGIGTLWGLGLLASIVASKL